MDFAKAAGNARFPLGPSAFVPNLPGSILNTTGPALRDLAGRYPQDRGDQVDARLRPGTEWVVTENTGEPSRNSPLRWPEASLVIPRRPLRLRPFSSRRS